MPVVERELVRAPVGSRCQFVCGELEAAIVVFGLGLYEDLCVHHLLLGVASDVAPRAGAVAGDEDRPRVRRRVARPNGHGLERDAPHLPLHGGLDLRDERRNRRRLTFAHHLACMARVAGHDLNRLDLAELFLPCLCRLHERGCGVEAAEAVGIAVAPEAERVVLRRLRR